MAGALIGAVTLPTPACAQDERPTGYPRSANERSTSPVTFSGVYTAEVRANVAGGLDRGVRYLDNLDLQVALDAERLIGWNGARAFAYAIHNNGVSFSRSLSGDAQGLSNIETGVKATRLFEAWIEQDVGRDASLKAGLYNLNSEFDTTISGGLFMLSSHGIGADLAQTGENGPSIFPVTSLAVRAEWAPSDRLLLRAAVLDGVPGDPSRPAATVIQLSKRDGALIIGEGNYLTRRAKIAVGLWTYTAAFEPLDGKRPERGNSGVYAFVEHQLTGEGERGARGLSGWVRVGTANSRINPIGSYLGAGLVQTGTLPGRPDDQVGVSVAVATFGGCLSLRRAGCGSRDRGGSLLPPEHCGMAQHPAWIAGRLRTRWRAGHLARCGARVAAQDRALTSASFLCTEMA